MQHHSPLQIGSWAVPERSWADRICSTTNYLAIHLKSLTCSNPEYFSWKYPKNLLRLLSFNAQFLNKHPPFHTILLSCEKFGIGISYLFVSCLCWFCFIPTCLWNVLELYSVYTYGWCQKWHIRAFWRKSTTMVQRCENVKAKTHMWLQRQKETL